jgi:hypothetical protein
LSVKAKQATPPKPKITDLCAIGDLRLQADIVPHGLARLLAPLGGHALGLICFFGAIGWLLIDRMGLIGSGIDFGWIAAGIARSQDWGSPSIDPSCTHHGDGADAAGLRDGHAHGGAHPGVVQEELGHLLLLLYMIGMVR